MIWICTLYFAFGLKLGDKMDVWSMTVSILGYFIFAMVYLITIKEFTFRVDDLNKSRGHLREAVEDLEARGGADPELVRMLLRDIDNLEPVSGYGLFGVDRTTLTSMMSTAITYLIILIQFKSSS